MPSNFDRTLDVKGLKCPQPLLQSRRAIIDMPVGGVLQVITTDRGSLADFEGWATVAKNIELLAQETTQQNGEVLYVHYVRRAK